MKEKYFPPKYNETAFNCPHCGVFSAQKWSRPKAIINQNWQAAEPFWIVECYKCKDLMVWHDKEMIFPINSGIENPNDDLSENVKTDYNEARDIIQKSPRGSAALLRLALQKLCKDLGGKGKNINDDIGLLVKQGLPKKIQQALDSVRVIGNEAVHPGVLDIKDDIITATKLFSLINIIADRMITHEKEIDAIYSGLPETKRQQIEKRDKI